MLVDKIIERIRKLDGMTDEEALAEVDAILKMTKEANSPTSLFTLKVNDLSILMSYHPWEFQDPIDEAKGSDWCHYLEVFDEDVRCYAWYKIPGGRLCSL